LPIYSTLAVSNPKFRNVVDQFLEKLDRQLGEMHLALQEQNWNELYALGHWLKGSGGTCGFSATSATFDPALALEDAAKLHDSEAAIQALQAIEKLRPRLMVASDEGGESTIATAGNVVSITNSSAPLSNPGDDVDTPVTSSLLAENPKFRKIVEKFIPRLGEQLEAMDVALVKEDFETVAEIAHWLKGSGGNVGFNGFTNRSLKLELAAKASDKDQTAKELSEVRRYASRVIAGWDDQPPEQVSA